MTSLTRTQEDLCLISKKVAGSEGVGGGVGKHIRFFPSENTAIFFRREILL